MTKHLSEPEFKTHLQNELTRRCRQNARYSLRSFARMLAMDASSVSQILCGKRRASARMMEKICAKIGWPERRPEVGPEAGPEERAAAGSQDSAYFLLSQDCFAAIADWYHYAILDLTLLKSFKKDPA
jgi:transcriptional regulator with XRE-family HTH domain